VKSIGLQRFNIAGRVNVKRTLSPRNNHKNFASFGGTNIGIREVMLYKNFTHALVNIVHGATVITPQGKTIGGEKAASDVSGVNVVSVDSHNRYPLSFFYIYYTPAFEKSQVKILLIAGPARILT